MQPPGVPRWTSTRWRAACCLLVILASGCSSFQRHWKEVRLTQPTQTGLVGAWEGTWASEASRHRGRLRCLIQQQGPTNYQAWFRANYAGILNFGYKVPLQVIPAPDRQTFHGEANLGYLIGGVYTYDGYAATTNLFSSYRCRMDHGRFDLVRPSPLRTTPTERRNSP